MLQSRGYELIVTDSLHEQDRENVNLTRGSRASASHGCSAKRGNDKGSWGLITHSEW